MFVVAKKKKINVKIKTRAQAKWKTAYGKKD